MSTISNYLQFYSPIQIGNTTLASRIINTPQLQATEYICCPEFLTNIDDHSKLEPQYTKITVNTVYAPSIKAQQATIGPVKINDDSILCSTIQCDTIDCKKLIKVSKIEISDIIQGSALTINSRNGVIDCDWLVAQTKIQCKNLVAIEEITTGTIDAINIRVGTVEATGNVTVTGDIIASNLPADNNAKVNKALWGAAQYYLSTQTFKKQMFIKPKNVATVMQLEFVMDIVNNQMVFTTDGGITQQYIDAFKETFTLTSLPKIQLTQANYLKRDLSVRCYNQLGTEYFYKITMEINNQEDCSTISFSADGQTPAKSKHDNCYAIYGTHNSLDICVYKQDPGVSWG